MPSTSTVDHSIDGLRRPGRHGCDATPWTVTDVLCYGVGTRVRSAIEFVPRRLNRAVPICARRRAQVPFVVVTTSMRVRLTHA